MSDDVKVCIRVRPLISRELSTEQALSKWTTTNDTVSQVDDRGNISSTYTFDRVFDGCDTTADLYEENVSPVVESAMRGFHSTIFAYGQTSSGKTFTMVGSRLQAGVISCALDEVYHIIQITPEREFLLRLSYIELYNEKLVDLLDTEVKSLKIQLDQDALFFLRKFFTELAGGTMSETPPKKTSNPASRQTSPSSPASKPSPPAPPPVMAITDTCGKSVEVEEVENLIKFDEISQEGEANLDGQNSDLGEHQQKQPVFFKSFVFSPDVPIRLDYHGKRVGMEHGTLAGLFAGLAQLNCSQLKLKRINYKHGLLGVDKLVLYSLNEWLADIKKNQIPSILGGVGPMYSFVQIVQGIRDLFWLPVEQYKRDGRIVRGIQRGATSFMTSTAMAVLELTNRLVQSVQYVAELTYDMVSPGPSVRQQQTQYQQLQYKIKRSMQPTDLREGITNAYVVLREGISGTVKTIVKVAANEHDQKGLTGAVGGVLRQIPPTMVQPIILASAATSNVLGGMRNQLKPDAKREDEGKWRVQEESNVKPFLLKSAHL